MSYFVYLINNDFVCSLQLNCTTRGDDRISNLFINRFAAIILKLKNLIIPFYFKIVLNLSTICWRSCFIADTEGGWFPILSYNRRSIIDGNRKFSIGLIPFNLVILTFFQNFLIFQIVRLVVPSCYNTDCFRNHLHWRSVWIHPITNFNFIVGGLFWINPNIPTM
ncbi:hypothetical protein SORDD24_00246 [Streptococcus oralis]|uniref:Uncharacterized protein n=1 Tax=Streptococcus oralis TaxID=1303 RepID=A0A139QUH5_STROR|nr:hypothetical protein SORDD24_00246 [Streptococcus oralis]